MPKLNLTTWKLNRRDGRNFEAEPLSNGPRKTVEIGNLVDAKRELAIFADEAKATGKPWIILATFDKRSGRAPAGLNKALAADELQAFVNEELCKGGA
jgi:hypothetical protein